MKRKFTTMTLMLAALGCAGAIQAHHSGSMYQKKPIWIEGTVVKFEHKNPHTIFTLEDRSADGQVHEWSVEGPGQSQLDSRPGGANAPEIGETLRVCAFPYKSVEELSRLFPQADFSGRSSTPEAVAGHVLKTADGQMSLWEAHGVLAECIRSSDEPRQVWIDFLNSDRRVRDAWCEQRRYTPAQEDASLDAFVEEINDSIDNPCR